MSLEGLKDLSTEKKLPDLESMKKEVWKAFLDTINNQTDFATFYEQFSSIDLLLSQVLTPKKEGQECNPAENYLRAIIHYYEAITAMHDFEFGEKDAAIDPQTVIKLMKYAKNAVGSKLAEIQDHRQEESPIKTGDGEVATRLMQELNHKKIVPNKNINK